MAARVILDRAAPQMGRKLRSPRHTFSIRQRPWHIQPHMIAPVLPGETMSNLLVQALVVTDPIKSRLIGWWYEQYYFYVKHRDLREREQLTEMHLNPDAPMLNLMTPPDPITYHNGGIDWTRLCLNRVVEEYFRNEGEDIVDVAGLPLASINTDSWLDSAKLASAGAAPDHQLPGEVSDPQLPSNVPYEFQQHYQQWEAMRALQLVTVTFEDYLKSFGVRAPKADRVEELHRPELIRYIRDWQLPAGIVAPDGSPANGVIWRIAERADKDRFFSEPGFILGVTVCRPKVYLGNQMGAAVSVMDDAYSWLPAVLSDQSYTSLRQMLPSASDTEPFPVPVDETWWFDLKDLFLYGDQFVNYTLQNEPNAAALPAPDLQRRYVSVDDMNDLFVAPERNLIRSDGVVSLSIKSRVTDTSGHTGGGMFAIAGNGPQDPGYGGGGTGPTGPGDPAGPPPIG